MSGNECAHLPIMVTIEMTDRTDSPVVFLTKSGRSANCTEVRAKSVGHASLAGVARVTGRSGSAARASATPR